MLKSRLFNGAIATALLVMFVLLVFQSLATAEVASTSEVRAFVASAGAPASAGCAFAGDPVDSIHAVYEPARGLWLARTTHGYAGVDGGAMELRNCQVSGR
jgi:hypothetical protein